MSTAVIPDAPEPRLLVEPSKALPLVAITLAFKTGAVEDPPGKEGLSRITARLMRRTAGGMPAEALDERIDALGGALGVDITHSSVSFHGTVIRRSTDEFVALMSDIVGKPSLSEPELERLKRETEAELIESRDNDRGLARRWFRRKVFDAHPYCRPVSGTIESIRSISRDDVLTHYGRCVRTGSSVVVLAGDVDEERSRAIAGSLMATVRPGAPPETTPLDPRVLPGRRLLVVDKPERTQTQVLIGGLGTHPADEDHIPLHVANTIFGGTFTARLMQEVRSKRGWSYGAYSSLPYDRKRRTFSLWTFPKAEDAAACIRLELDLLEKWRTDGVTKKELEWAKRYLVRSHAFAIDTAAKRAALSLDEAIYDLPDGYHSRYLDNVRSVTLESANAAIQNRISTQDLLIVVVGTASQILDPVKDAIRDLSSVETIPFDTDG